MDEPASKRGHTERGKGSDDEGSEDVDLSLLPRHTKVVITGNNRTKTALVGQHGLVTKAVGLGGWHWLTLANGEEVRLQRNALSVLEHPNPEEVKENEALEARQAAAAAAAAVASRHHQQNGFGTHNSLGPRSSVNGVTKRATRPQQHSYNNPNLSSQRKTSHQHQRKASVMRAPGHHPSGGHHHSGKRETMAHHATTINFSKLESGSLRKYRRHYKLPVGPNATKDQLVHAVQVHCSGETVDESHVLAGFILALHGMSPPSTLRPV